MAEEKQSRAEKLNTRESRYKFHLEHGVNIEERIIIISGTIGDETTFDHVDAAMTALERESKNPITVRICSGGGSVSEALAIVGRLRASPCDVVTEGYGIIASAATLVLACGNHRRLSRFTTMLVHESSTWLGGKTSAMKEELDQLEREEKQWAGWMAEMSKLTAKQWRQRIVKVEWYMNAEECLEIGVVDELI
jgi:ATP-dependent Clp protease protease subunit